MNQHMDRKPFGGAFGWTNICSWILCKVSKNTTTISSARKTALGYLVSLLIWSAWLPWGVLRMEHLHMHTMIIYAWMSAQTLRSCTCFFGWRR
jgi:hypothetical protein